MAQARELFGVAVARTHGMKLRRWSVLGLLGFCNETLGQRSQSDIPESDGQDAAYHSHPPGGSYAGYDAGDAADIPDLSHYSHETAEVPTRSYHNHATVPQASYYGDAAGRIAGLPQAVHHYHEDSSVGMPQWAADASFAGMSHGKYESNAAAYPGYSSAGAYRGESASAGNDPIHVLDSAYHSSPGYAELSGKSQYSECEGHEEEYGSCEDDLPETQLDISFFFSLSLSLISLSLFSL